MICSKALVLGVQLMSTSDSYSLQKERPEPTEREAWNERERERETEMEKEGWIAQENELPLSELPNHVRPYRKLVTIYSQLQGIQRKFC